MRIRPRPRISSKERGSFHPPAVGDNDDDLVSVAHCPDGDLGTSSRMLDRICRCLVGCEDDLVSHVANHLNRASQAASSRRSPRSRKRSSESDVSNGSIRVCMHALRTAQTSSMLCVGLSEDASSSVRDTALSSRARRRSSASDMFRGRFEGAEGSRPCDRAPISPARLLGCSSP